MSGKTLLILLFLVLAGLVVGAAVITMQSAPTSIGSGDGGPVTKLDEEELRELPPLRDRPAPTTGEVAGLVVDPDGQPVAGATVSLSVHRDHEASPRGFNVRMGGSGMSSSFIAAPPAGHSAVGSVTTGEDGSFAFTTSEKGPFTVRADCTGFGSVLENDVLRGTRDLVLKLDPSCTIRGLVHDELGATVPGVVVSGGLASTLTGEAGGFVLADVGTGSEVRILAQANGYESATLDLALDRDEERVLEEPLVIQSKAGLTGRVFDPVGGPLEGAVVRVATNLMNMSTESTDEGGRYFFESPGEGSVGLLIRHREYLEGNLEGIRYRKGERVVAPDVRLQPGGVIAGRIVGPDGQPIAGARAVAIEEGNEFDMAELMVMGMGMGEDTRPGSDADGRYRVPGLSTGTYLLSVSADGYRPFVQRQIDVQVPETTTIEVVLDPGLSIAGRVVDAAGEPLAGAKISAITDEAAPDPENLKEQMLIGDWSAQVETSGDGAFFLSGLGESKVHLTIEKFGYSKQFVDDIEPGTSDLVVTLEETGSISGRVIDGESGEPVPGASVTADDSTSGRTKTEEDGSFSLGSVSPGELTVSVDSDEHLPEEHAGVTVVSGSPTTGVEIRLRRGETLSGIVVRASNGSAVADASVSADGPVSRYAKTDEQGRFTLKGLAKGVYDLEASSKKFADASLDNVAIPNRGEVRIELLSGGTIRGVVLDESGEPVSGQMVMSGSGPDMFGNMATTGADGTFVFENVPAGNQTLMVMKLQTGEGKGFGFGANTRSVVVVEGEEVFVTFGGAGAPKKTRLTGRLLDRGRPAGGRMLIFMRADIEGGMAEIMTSFKMVTTGQDGSFDVADLDAGNYRVFSGNMGGDMGASMELAVSDEGGVLEQDLTLPDGIFAGTVVRSDTGAAVAGAKLLIVDPQLIMNPATSLFDIMALMKGQFTSDEDGAFSTDTAARGTVLLQVFAPDLAPAVIEGINIGSAPGQPLRISLVPPTPVEVRVKDSVGEPVIGASILIFDGKGRRLMVMEDNMPSTSSDGTATINLSAGTWRILVQPKGLSSAMREINLPGKAEVDLVLRPGGTLSTVVTSAGGPLAEAVIRTFDASGIEVAHHLTQEGMMMGAPSRKTGEDGRHTREHLPAGTYRVTATAPDGRTGVGSARIADGGTTELAIEVK